MGIKGEFEVHDVTFSCSLYNARRKIAPLAGISLGWSEEEKLQLVQLVTTMGMKWVEIGRVMSKLGDECKSCYGRIRDKDKVILQSNHQNRFGIDEDLSLVKAVRRCVGSKKCAMLQAVPDSGLPWTAIAAKLEGKRQPKDLMRRWPNLKRFFLRQLGLNCTFTEVSDYLLSQSVQPKYMSMASDETLQVL